MKMLWTLALKELRDGFRNRWVAAAITVLGILALVLSVLGSAPTGSVRVSELDISVISLASLSVYLIPLIALMLSYDALVGEVERGTMLLLMAYPVERWQIVLGKLLGHVAILGLAIAVGYGITGGAVAWLRGGTADGIWAFTSMMAASLLLGAVFVGFGYVASALARERSTAAGVAIGIWIGLRTLNLSGDGIDFINGASLLCFVLCVTWMATRIVETIFREILEPLTAKTDTDLDDQLLPVARKGSKLVIWALGTIVALNNVGYDVGAVLAGLGIGGLALAMAARDTVANVFGGVTVFTDRPFAVNDRILIDGYEGFVREIGIRTTRIQTMQGPIG